MLLFHSLFIGDIFYLCHTGLQQRSDFITDILWHCKLKIEIAICSKQKTAFSTVRRRYLIQLVPEKLSFDKKAFLQDIAGLVNIFYIAKIES